jgi:glucokinase
LSARLLGLNVGGTTTTIVTGDERGAIAQRHSFPTAEGGDGESLFGALVRAIAAARGPQTAAVGVAIGGPLDARRGVVLGAPHLPFADFPLLDRLRAEVDLPLAVHHDAAACALAEWRWGPDRGKSGVAYLTCGTGFGVGLVLDGRVRYGSTGHSPEIGHVRYRDDGPEIFGKRGCFEGFGSASALALLARERDPARLGALSPQAIAELAAAGDRGAAKILRQNAEAVGAACALLADLLVLDVIVLGSLAHYLGEPWIADVRAVFAEEALPANVGHCTLRAPIDDVQDLSALAAAMDAS